jgi:DNA-binding SARP family transcriptional activator
MGGPGRVYAPIDHGYSRVTLEVRLGPLEVRFGNGPVDLGPRKQRAVLAMLALEAGRTVSADRLPEGLWGDRLPPSAAKMAQLYVSHLRRAPDDRGYGS